METGIIEDLGGRGVALVQMAGVRVVAGSNDVFAEYDNNKTNDDDDDDDEAELHS
jgi:hypothetical protein